MKITISRLVVFSACLLLLIAMTLISFLTWQSSTSAIYELSNNAYRQAGTSLAEQLATSVRFNKQDNISEKVALALEANQGNLEIVTVYLTDGHVLYSSDKSIALPTSDITKQTAMTSHDDNGAFVYTVPLFSGKKKTYIGQLVTRWNYNKVAALSQSLSTQSLAAAAVCIIVSVISLLILLRQVLVKPLAKLTTLCRELSSGDCDLHQRINFKRNNELGELAGRINQFIDKTEKTLIPIHQNSLSVTQISEDLESHLSSMQNKVNEQRDQVKMVVSIGEQTQGNVDTVKSIMEQTSRYLSKAVCSAKTGQNRLNEALTSMELIAQQNQDISDAAGEVSNQSHRVTEILGIIRGIADQTNLLALNAAIEAARAGESGRGFAVVADEVRGLAEKTSASTNQVEEILNELATVSDQLIQHTEEGLQASEKGLASIDNAVTDIEGALGDVSAADKASSSIRDASDEQLSLMNELVSQLTSLEVKIDALVCDSQQIASSSVQLHHKANETSQCLSNYNLA